MPTELPTFKGVMYVGLSVRDVRRSAAWYEQVMGFQREYENVGASRWKAAWDEVLLRHPDSGLLLGLLHHPRNTGAPFSEFRTGLDHLEFEVENPEALDAWRGRLDEFGIRHSGNRPHIVTFRDRDNIQLEFFYRVPPGSGPDV